MLNPFTHKKILKKGTPGQAIIHSMAIRERDATLVNLPMTLQVFVEGEVPYEVEDQWMVSSKDSLGFGMKLPIKVSPKNPLDVAIDWDEHKKNSAAATKQRRETLTSLGPVGPNGPALGAPLDAAAVAEMIRNAPVHDDPKFAADILEHLGTEFTVAPPSPNPVDADDMVNQLERLAALRDSGVLSHSEFNEQKRRLLKTR